MRKLSKDHQESCTHRSISCDNYRCTD